MTNDLASLNKSKFVRLTILFAFVLPVIFLPLTIHLMKTLSPETILKLGTGLPFFNTNLDFLLRNSKDNEGLSVAISVSGFILVIYVFASGLLLAALISKRIQDECLFLVLTSNAVLARLKTFPRIFQAFIYLGLAMHALAGWNSETIFGGMHAYSNMSDLRVVLSTVQVAVYGFAVLLILAFVIGEFRNMLLNNVN